jgi:uncharacterized protein YbjT (DUF2867 family)
MLLLTGATGQVGSALLRRLTEAGRPVRCLVRDPRRLGPARVRVQIVLGDLADPPSFRNALRGVDTVVHLAASRRDQPQGSIEELGGIATWRMVEAAERAGVGHFIFAGALGSSPHSPSRFLRAKALAERAVQESALPHTVVRPSLVLSPGDPFVTLFERLAILPAVPVPLLSRALFQPVWADDVAACLERLLERPGGVHDIAGPETLGLRAVARTILRAAGRDRPLVPVPGPLVRAGLRSAEALMKSKAPATWDEAELLSVSLTSPTGSADAEALGVSPAPLGAVLGAA